MIRFREWYERLDVIPTIVAIRHKLEAIAEAEIKKTLNLSNISHENAKALYRMTHALINKILHDPIQVLKSDGHRNSAVLLDIARRLFKLDDDS